MGFLEDILLGSISKGVNNATLIFINFSLVGCIALLAGLIFSGGIPPDVVPHLAIVLFFAIGLTISVNWVVSQTGTVSPIEQRKEIFGGPEEERELATVPPKQE
ncbi:hypothetical protein Ndes2526B_g01062 [Nannochloris sp. 'desiccata']